MLPRAPLLSEFTDKNIIELHPYLMRFAMSWTNKNFELSEDLVQDTIVKAYAHRQSFKPGSNLVAWLLTILKNERASYFRRSWRWKLDSDNVEANKQAQSPRAFDAVVLKDTETALSRLPYEQRQALAFIALGFSYEDVAKATNCAEGTVKSRVARARARMKEGA